MKKQDESLAPGFEVAPAPAAKVSPPLTPQAIQDKEFTVARFGGYRMRDVDEFLDELTASMQRLTEENARLLAGGAGEPADATVAQARKEADRIVADARRQAAAISGGNAEAAGDPEDRAAIQAFLTREREFLQSLASLVQEHVDAVKEMARETRRSPSASAAGAVASAEHEPTGTQQADAAGAQKPGPAAGEEAGAGRDLPTEAIAPVDKPIRVEEPAPASALRSEPSGGETEGSLRELFWGEDE